MIYALLGGIDQKHASQSLEGSKLGKCLRSKSSSGSGNSIKMSPLVEKGKDTIAISNVIVKVISMI